MNSAMLCSGLYQLAIDRSPFTKGKRGWMKRTHAVAVTPPKRNWKLYPLELQSQRPLKIEDRIINENISAAYTAARTMRKPPARYPGRPYKGLESYAPFVVAVVAAKLRKEDRQI